MVSESQATTFTELNKIKFWQGETYLKKIMLEDEGEYLGATVKL